MSSTLALFASLLLLASCSNTQRPQWVQDLGEATGIISNRPSPKASFFALVKLQSPALLAGAEKNAEGVLKVNAQQVKALQQEQDAALAEIKKISDQIKVIYRYKMVLNAFALVGPSEFIDKLKLVGNIATIESNGNFARPRLTEFDLAAKTGKQDLSLANSVKWIGATDLHLQKVRGQKIKVGVIDTGIDYTHAMFGGPGTETAYKAIDPSKQSLLFPTNKVVGGLDFVGTAFDSSSGDFQKHIPIPDSNPMDEAGHGTHVAGTIAGIGDSINTYDGVAPDAELYALKVFGADGSTSDAAVIAALEYSADPKSAGTGEGRLDVVNLSLGSAFGSAHILYAEAVHNLTLGGTIMVASAGNEGDNPYIVGAPSVVDDALSVAASVDNAPQNWKFDAVKFVTSNRGNILTEAIQGPISKPITEIGDVHGNLVFAGLAKEDFSGDLADQIKGQVAFIDRGGSITFADKVGRAFKAGAVGVVIGNNQPGEPIPMGGEGHYEIPAIMITQALADALKEDLKAGVVVVQFQNPEKIEKPELIDSIAGFSSKGPRTQDSGFKPEISAPGQNVISAEMGGGAAGVALSGTSMAGPHMAGAMALLRQVHPELSVAELKSMLMGRALTISDSKKQVYPLTRQGAGRAQVDRALKTPVVASRSSISLGEVAIETRKRILSEVAFKNITKSNLDLQVVFKSDSGLSYQGPSSIAITTGTSQALKFSLTVDSRKMTSALNEMDGLLLLMKGSEEIFRVPVLAMVHRISAIQASDLVINATSSADATGSAAVLKIKNESSNRGRVLLFNSLGEDGRKQDPSHDAYKNRGCDLQAAGYRVISKTVDGKKIQVLQVGAKLYEAMTTWNTCEISVQLDSDGDDIADQELALVSLGNVKGLSSGANEYQMASVLLDAKTAREIRKNYELALKKPADPKKPVVEDYSPALIDGAASAVFNNSTVALVEVDVTSLARTPTGEIAVKIATLHNEESTPEADDYLADGFHRWKKISLEANSQSFTDLPETILVQPGEEKTLEFTVGEARENLLALMPDNRSVASDLEKDLQASVLRGSYKLP